MTWSKRMAIVALAAGIGVALAGTGDAHHSIAMFDRNKTVVIQGTIKSWQYTNPHSWLYVVTRDPAGKEETWGFEADGPGTLLRMGIKKTTFIVGDKVAVTANPMRDGTTAGMWLNVRKANGETVVRTNVTNDPGSQPTPR